MKLDARTKLLMGLAGLFITALIIGDLIGGKLYQTSSLKVFGLPLTISVGMIPFPIVFLLTDVINEFYGQKTARFVTWIGFAMTWFVIAVIQVANLVPFAEFTTLASWTGIDTESFERVFTSSTRILLSSTAAYLVAQLVDIGVFHFLRRRTGGKALWLRATGSTVVSQLFDTVIIQFLAWSGKMSVESIVSIILTSYVVKLVVAIGMTPVVYGAHAVLERWMAIAPLDD